MGATRGKHSAKDACMGCCSGNEITGPGAQTMLEVSRQSDIECFMTAHSIVAMF